MKLNLKLLYFLTLGALCLYVTSGPASATSVVGSAPLLVNLGIVSGTSTGDDGTQLDWTGVAWEELYGYTVHLDATATCQGAAGQSCAGTVGFSFAAFSPGRITVSLVGTSDDSGAEGTADLYGTTQPWSISGGNISMTPFLVNVPGSFGAYFGHFDIASLAAGHSLELPIDLGSGSSVPEPGSALLLVGGIGLVEFLRRKIRR